MTKPVDPRLAPHLDTIEQQLVDRATRAGLPVPAGHRDRVLAAVRDTLAGSLTTPAAPPPGLDAGSRAALGAMAISALVVIVAPWVAIAGAMTRGTERTAEPVIVAQARAAGIELPVHDDRFALQVATTRDANHAPISDAGDLPHARRREIGRLKTLLEELL
jgi:hypothetical protein